MEKKTPHYNLTEIKVFVAQHGIRAFTQTARMNGFAMGLSQKELVSAVLTMRPSGFFQIDDQLS